MIDPLKDYIHSMRGVESVVTSDLSIGTYVIIGVTCLATVGGTFIWCFDF